MDKFLTKKGNTTSGLKTAEEKLNVFLQQEYNKSLKCDNNHEEEVDNASNTYTTMTEADVNEDLFDQFGKYLYELKYKSLVKDGEIVWKNYAPGTVLQYFSGALVLLRDKFPNLSLWAMNYDANSKSPEWYATARCRLSSKLMMRIIENGQKIQENKSSPLGRDVLIEMAETCERVSKNQSSIEMRLMFVTHFLVCGRTAESALASWNQAEWDEAEGALVMDWSMEKVSKQKTMAIFNDQTDNWLVDFDVAMFEFMLCPSISDGGEGDRREKWMFPHLALCNKPGDKINYMMKKITKTNDEKQVFASKLTQSHTGGSFRIGSINEIVSNPYCGITHAALFAGHDYSQVCTVFEYALASLHMICSSARAVAGSVTAGLRTPAPRPVFLYNMSEEEKNQTLQFFKTLLNLRWDCFQENGRLWGYVERMIAAYVMHYPSIVRSRSRDHFITEKIDTEFYKSGNRVTKSKIILWSEEVRQDLAARRVTDVKTMEMNL